MSFEDIKNARNPFREYYAKYCPYFTTGLVLCKNQKRCISCEFADRMRQSIVLRNKNLPLFVPSDALRQTKKGGGDTWWHFPIILSEEVMDRLGLEKNVFFQIAIAEGGGGVFKKNPVGPVDCHLFANPSKKFTISRNEAYGIPDERAVRRYDELFFMDLHKVIKYARTKIGVWCL